MFSCCCAETVQPADILAEDTSEGGSALSSSSKTATAATATTHAAAEPEPAAETHAAAATAADPSASAGSERREKDSTNEVPSIVEAKKGLYESVTPSKDKTDVTPKKPISVVKGDRARRTSVPLEAPIDEGAFLMYDSSKDALYALWSSTPQPAALAWLKPLVSVPLHKYKVHGCRQNLCSNVKEGSKYYEGWMKFISITNEYPSKLMLLDNLGAPGGPPDVHVLQLVPSGGSKSETEYIAEQLLECNKLYDLKNVKAIAVVPVTSSLIPIGKPLDPQKFLQMGKGEGSAAPVQMKKV